MAAQQPSFSVRRHAPILIFPAKPTPNDSMYLSDIDDQEGLRFYIPALLFYRSDNSSIPPGHDPVPVIRDAISKALVFYYPLAGRLREVGGKKLMVECTADGVQFLEADADVLLDQFGERIHPPISCWEELLPNVKGSVGILHSPLLLFQVTRLSCGGFVLGIQMNHTVCDGAGLKLFITAVAELARGAQEPTVLPVWRRELLSARDPPLVTCAHREYRITMSCPKTSEEGPKLPYEFDAGGANIVHRYFFFGPREMAALRKRVHPEQLRSRSNIVILSAFIWRCRTVALQMCPEDEVRVLFIVDARAAMNPPLPSGYYGNAFAFSMAFTTAKELCANSLGYAVELISKAKAAVTDEYMRSLADFLATNGRPFHVVERTLILSDVTRMNTIHMDFGWGPPLYAGPVAADERASFYLSSISSRGEPGILLPICMPTQAMDRFADEIERWLNDPVSPVPMATSSL